MRITIRPRPQVAVKPEIRTFRPPDDFLDILNKSESEFREYINDIESNPLFDKILSQGYVRKVNFKGRIPNHIYQDFRDREFMGFLSKYNIADKPGWEADFFDRKAVRKSKELAAKYRVPRGELIKALEYCRNLQFYWDGKKPEEFASFHSIDDTERFRQLEDNRVADQTNESVSILAELLGRYSISEDVFVENFLRGDPEPFEIARNLDIPINVAGDILEALEKVQITGSMQVNVVSQREKVYSSESPPVAFIKRLKDPPRAEIQIDENEEYSSRYSIENEENIGKEERMFLDSLKMINQRLSLTFRIIRFIYEFQYPYFVSSNPLHLKPLSQAQIAAEMGEQGSTVSRILKNKYIETPDGIVALKFFCQSKKDVIDRIVRVMEPAEISSGRRHEPFSDAEISDILKKEYNTEISRRTVTYYRNNIKGSPKFYARRKIAKR